MDSNNTVKALHIISKRAEPLELNANKMFSWHIPKSLREEPIQKGDIVRVKTMKGPKNVLVMDVFREELEDTQKRYKRVIEILERAPEK